jgi:hypothetical protein
MPGEAMRQPWSCQSFRAALRQPTNRDVYQNQHEFLPMAKASRAKKWAYSPIAYVFAQDFFAI